VVLVAHVSAQMVDHTRHEKEKHFLTTEGKQENFPSLMDPPSIELSVVKQNPSFTYEVIVVDDGSKDKTTEVAMKYTKAYGAQKVRVLTLVKNRGKGGAVRMGTLSSRGRLILMADADGATKFADIEKVEEGLESISEKPDNMAISVGSRAHLEKESVAQRSLFRTILMYGFHFLVWFFCVRGIHDTQCGFKLFTREAALKTFSSLHVERWVKVGAILELASDGSGSGLYQTALPHRCLEAGVREEDSVATEQRMKKMIPQCDAGTVPAAAEGYQSEALRLQSD
ncbi:hypothetical protein DNTS_022183, partial [Danionella cerebrum]